MSSNSLTMRFLLLVCCASLFVIAPAPALAQDVATIAQRRFLHGLELYDARRYEEALTEFRASYDLRASPNSRLYIARSLRDMGRLPDAVTEYETTIEEATAAARTDPRYEATRDAARTELSEIEGRIGRLRITVHNSAPRMRVRVGGRVVPPAALAFPIPVSPGLVEVVIEAEGRAPARRELDVSGGQTLNIDLTLESTRESNRTLESTREGSVATPSRVPRGSAFLRVATWTTLGLGIAGWASFAVFGTLGSTTYADLQMRCGEGPCAESERGTIAAGRTYQVTANVSLAFGIAGTIIGTTLLLFGGRMEAHHPVNVSVMPGEITIGGRF